MCNPISTLVHDLVRNVTTISTVDGTEFCKSIQDSLVACSTFESYLTGIAERQFVHCISQSLQQSADSAIDPSIRPYLWNPIVASLLKCISEMAYRQPAGDLNVSKPPGNKQSVLINRPNLSSAASKMSKMSLATGDTRKQKLAPKVAKLPEQGKGSKEPSTESRKVEYPRPTNEEILSVAGQHPSPFFKQLKGGRHGEPVDCRIPGCETCLRYFKRIPVTRCTDIRSHRPGMCHDSGWYPHILPHIWGNIKKAHFNNSHEVKFVGLPPDRCVAIHVDDTYAPLTKRRWTEPDDSDSDADGPVKRTPQQLEQTWASIVAEEEGGGLRPTSPKVSNGEE